VKKVRWLRAFGTGGGAVTEIPLNENEHPIAGPGFVDGGCRVEFTEVAPDGGEVWHTLGMEAFGPITSVEASLRLAAAGMARRISEFPEGGFVASYPGWLASLLKARR
jgi:hypothetical protein